MYNKLVNKYPQNMFVPLHIYVIPARDLYK